MSETQLPWGSSARFVKVICSLGLAIPDGADVDRNADLTMQSGKVTIVCNANKVRLIHSGEPGRMLSFPSAPFTIAPSTGELIDTQGVMGLYVLDPMSPGIDPQGFTYTATVVPNIGSPWSVTFGGNSILSDVVDLVRLASIAPATGVSTLEQRIEALEADTGSDAYPVQQVALTGNLAYTLPVDAPTDQIISVVFTQDGTGGHTVTYSGQPVAVDLSAGASTLVEIWPGGTVVYPDDYEGEYVKAALATPTQTPHLVPVVDNTSEGGEYFDTPVGEWCGDGAWVYARSLTIPPNSLPVDVALPPPDELPEWWLGESGYSTELYVIGWQDDGRIVSPLASLNYSITLNQDTGLRDIDDRYATFRGVFPTMAGVWAFLVCWAPPEGGSVFDVSLVDRLADDASMTIMSVAQGDGQPGLVSGTDVGANGNSGIASGVYSHAEGDYTTASGSSSHAEGDYTTASGSSSHAEGDYTTASGVSSHAEGHYTTASGVSSHAEGVATTASGVSSHAEGDYTTASGSSSHAEGDYTTASGVYSHAEGGYTTASGDYSHAGGYYADANRPSEFAQGATGTQLSLLPVEAQSGASKTFVIPLSQPVLSTVTATVTAYTASLAIVATWKVEALVACSSASARRLIGTPTVTKTFSDAGASGWTVAASVPAANQLNIACSGATAATKWSVSAYIHEGK